LWCRNKRRIQSVKDKYEFIPDFSSVKNPGFFLKEVAFQIVAWHREVLIDGVT